MKWVVRILIAVVGLVVLAVVGLWLAGFREGAGKNSATVEINRPPADVWLFLNDDGRVMKWASGIREIRHKTPGVTGVGNRFEMTVGMDNEHTDMEMEITAFEEPRLIAFNLKSLPGASPGFTERGEYRLEDLGGRTRLTLWGESKYFPAWVQLMEPMITPQAQKKLEGDLARLKRLAEAEPPQAK